MLNRSFFHRGSDFKYLDIWTLSGYTAVSHTLHGFIGPSVLRHKVGPLPGVATKTLNFVAVPRESCNFYRNFVCVRIPGTGTSTYIYTYTCTGIPSVTEGTRTRIRIYVQGTGIRGRLISQRSGWYRVPVSNQNAYTYIPVREYTRDQLLAQLL